MHLELPSPKYQSSFLAAGQEYRDAGESDRREAQVTIETSSNYLDSLEKESHDEIVPRTTFWLIDDDEYIGRISVQPNFPADMSLEEFGGHIGYLIRPSKRGMGYGTKILSLGLEKAAEIGLKEVLLLSKKSNLASQKVIERNSGIIVQELDGEEGQEDRFFYRISL
jgi:predicted acetyltransferase